MIFQDNIITLLVQDGVNIIWLSYTHKPHSTSGIPIEMFFLLKMPTFEWN